MKIGYGNQSRRQEASKQHSLEAVELSQQEGAVTAVELSQQWSCHSSGAVTAVELSQQWSCHSSGAVTAVELSQQWSVTAVLTNYCANCVNTSRPHQWEPDLPFFWQAGNADPLVVWHRSL